MVVVRFRGVNTVRRRLADGMVHRYYYHRATGLRLPDDPSSPEFAARLAELNAPEPGPGIVRPDSFAALIQTYKTHSVYLGKADKTRRDYGRNLDLICEHWGRNRVANIDKQHVLELQEAYQDTPAAANALVRVLRLLLSFACDRPRTFGLQANPAFGIKELKTGEGHRPWEEAEVAAFRETWPADSTERVWFELALNTGQRGGDVVAMTRGQYQGGTLRVRQLKTGALVGVPASDELKAVLDPWLAAQDAALESGVVKVLERSRRPLVPNSTGWAYKVDAFRHMMRDAYDTAGLPKGCTSHGLRYTAATRLFELGCDWHTIAAITGHETVDMVRKYAENERKAKLAIGRLNDSAAPDDRPRR